MGSGTRRIAHVVQTIEECHEVQIRLRVVLGRAHLEPDVGEIVLARVRLGVLDRAGMEVVPDELLIAGRLAP